MKRKRKGKKRKEKRKKNKHGEKKQKMECIPGGTSCKQPSPQHRRHKRCSFDPWAWKILWKRAWQPTPVFLPGRFHGERSLAGYSPRGCKESDKTEAT